MKMKSIHIMAALVTLFMVLAGCQQQESLGEEPAPETMQLAMECRDADNSTMDNCCMDDCLDYCNSNGFLYEKHYLNNIHCVCWCANR